MEQCQFLVGFMGGPSCGALRYPKTILHLQPIPKLPEKDLLSVIYIYIYIYSIILLPSHQTPTLKTPPLLFPKSPPIPTYSTYSWVKIPNPITSNSGSATLGRMQLPNSDQPPSAGASSNASAMASRGNCARSHCSASETSAAIWVFVLGYKYMYI